MKGFSNTYLGQTIYQDRTFLDKAGFGPGGLGWALCPAWCGEGEGEPTQHITTSPHRQLPGFILRSCDVNLKNWLEDDRTNHVKRNCDSHLSELHL